MESNNPIHIQLLKDWLISWLAKETPCILEYKEEDGKVFFDTTNESTNQIVSIVNCTKIFLCINKRNRLLLQENYTKYIGRILNLYYFDNIAYERNQAICKAYNITSLNKCIEKKFYARLLNILQKDSSNDINAEKDAHIIIDLCAYSESHWYIEYQNNNEVMIGKFGDHYDFTLVNLIQSHRNALLFFWNKVFQFGSNNSFTYNTRIFESIEAIKQCAFLNLFLKNCNHYGLTITKTQQRLLNNGLIKQNLENQYKLFNVISVKCSQNALILK